MEITECIIKPDGKREIKTLYRFNIIDTTIVNDKVKIIRHFEKVNNISEILQRRLRKNSMFLKVQKKLLKIYEDYMYISEKDRYKLEIEIDDFPVNYDLDSNLNLSTMICWHRRYGLGNNHNYGTMNDFFMDLVIDNAPKENVIDFVKCGKVDLIDIEQEDDNYVLTYYDKEKTEDNIYRKELFLLHEAIIDSIAQELSNYELLS